MTRTGQAAGKLLVVYRSLQVYRSTILRRGVFAAQAPTQANGVHGNAWPPTHTVGPCTCACVCLCNHCHLQVSGLPTVSGLGGGFALVTKQSVWPCTNVRASPAWPCMSNRSPGIPRLRVERERCCRAAHPRTQQPRTPNRATKIRPAPKGECLPGTRPAHARHATFVLNILALAPSFKKEGRSCEGGGAAGKGKAKF